MDVRAAVAFEAGKPLDGLHATGLLLRPARSGLDRPLAFHPAGDGVYLADYDLPISGLWELGLLLESADGRAQRTVRIAVP